MLQSKGVIATTITVYCTPWLFARLLFSSLGYDTIIMFKMLVKGQIIV